MEHGNLLWHFYIGLTGKVSAPSVVEFRFGARWRLSAFTRPIPVFERRWRILRKIIRIFAEIPTPEFLVGSSSTPPLSHYRHRAARRGWPCRHQSRISTNWHELVDTPTAQSAQKRGLLSFRGHVRLPGRQYRIDVRVVKSTCESSPLLSRLRFTSQTEHQTESALYYVVRTHGGSHTRHVKPMRWIPGIQRQSLVIEAMAPARALSRSGPER